MPEIGTSGSMSGDGKRGVGHKAPSYRAHPRLYHCCRGKRRSRVRQSSGLEQTFIDAFYRRQSSVFQSERADFLVGGVFGLGT